MAMVCDGSCVCVCVCVCGVVVMVMMADYLTRFASSNAESTEKCSATGKKHAKKRQACKLSDMFRVKAV